MRKKYSKSQSRSSEIRQRRSRRKEKREAERVIRLSFPLLDVVASARESVDRMVVDVGLEVMRCLLEDEVAQRLGSATEGIPSGRPSVGGTKWATWSCALEKVPLDRPRVRTKDGREIALERYRLFQGPPSLHQREVAKRVLAQVCTRNYEEVIDTISEGYGRRGAR